MPKDRINQSIILADGRHLGFAEYGSRTGTPVIFFNGSGSSRLEHPSPLTMLDTLNIRFISTDRPGHGLSGFQPQRRLLVWPDDVSQLADHLGLDRFYVAGHSAGGPHALACAYVLPERVIAGAVISSIAPMHRAGAYKGMPLPNQLLALASRYIPGVTYLIRRMMRNMIMDDVEKATQQLMASIPESDKAALYDPTHIDVLVYSLREGFRQGHKAVALDDCITNQDWGFDIADIQPRIDVWHGKTDVNVPIHAANYLHDHLPNARVTILPDAGHFFVLSRWEEVLSQLMVE